MDRKEISDDYERRHAQALAMGGAAKLQRRRDAGLLDARARLAALFDEGSFAEVGLFAFSGPDAGKAPADGKIAGFGRIAGREAAAMSNDFTVMGASSTMVNGRKIAHMKRVAAQRGLPLVFLGESSGARIPETMGAAGMGASGSDPAQYLRLRETPWAAAILGPCYGSSSWYSCLSDFKVMRKGALLSVSSAPLVKQATGATLEPEALGGWLLHAETTGLVDQVVDSDEEAIDAIRRFLSYLPSHNAETPPLQPVPRGSGEQMPGILELLPERETQVYDMKKIIRAIVDRDSFFELKARFGKTGITGLARLGGRAIGIIASNPLHKGGALEIAACRKIASFIVLCDSFNIPLVNLVDVPGFAIGLEAEQAGAPARIMNYMTALQLATVPKLTVILRKLYGQAYLNMGGGRNSDEIAVWPTAEIGFMAPAAGVTVVDGLSPGDPGFDDRLAELARETSPWVMAANFHVQQVIRPHETRDWLVRMLEVHQARGTAGVGRHLMQSWPCYL
ncbi:Methylmalonyl-CoA carboxyltransferase 12S subunit (plasmid) [Variovorax sp. SRS16]|uniref:acyl-CoA carboxylase subunit beta n=1 Tax=Variovorax sp. SRS16 TaxID=282217 RepID=UPI0013180858|nr:carboxyl transferase domain-containing protein [Variovorax sp. SRS16]VTU46503.1 Methylmalonyl-CoA carboxyltransferase 12S subunit [Variovorax sp. SRS16]